MTYRYYIAYTCSGTAGGLGFGQSEVRRSAPITGIADLQQVQAGLRAQGVQQPLIINFTRFDEPVTPPRLDEV